MKLNSRDKPEIIKSRLEEIKQTQLLGNLSFRSYLELAIEAEDLRRILASYD
jgi:hypothetical protein